MKKDIFEKELAKIVEISREFKAEKVFLFGSSLENAETAHDIDIAVKGIGDRDFFKYYGRISLAVDDEVDIVDLDDVREHLHDRIVSKGRVIYEKSV